MARLVELMTEHPGGWEDIIAHVKDKKSIVTLVEYDVHFGVDTRGRDYRGVKSVTVERKMSSNFVTLGEIQGSITGRVAAMGWEWLRINGYPVPGDEDWLKPAEEWS